MSFLIKKFNNSPIPFLLISSTDHIAAVTGITPTVTLSKNSSAFTSASGTISEIANGWYSLSASSADTNTLGTLIVHATGTGSDPFDALYQIVAFDPQASTNLGLSNLDATISSRLATSAFSSSSVVVLSASQPFYAPLQSSAYSVSAIRVEMDNNSTKLANLDTTISSRASSANVALIPTNPLLTTDVRLNDLDATISSRLATSAYTVPPTVVLIRQEMDNNSVKLSYLDGHTSALATQSSVNLIPTTTLLSGDTRLNYLNANISAIPTNPLLTTDTRLNTLDATISSRLATSAYTAPNNITTSAIRIEMDTNSNKLIYLNQYTSAINNIPTNPLLTTDVRLNDLDATISSRLATSAYQSIETNVVVLSASQPFYAPLQSSAYDSLAGIGFNTGTDSLHQIRTRVDAVFVATGTPIVVQPTSAIRIVGSDQGGTVSDLLSRDEVFFATGEDATFGLEVQIITSASTITENPSLVRVTGYLSDAGVGHQINVSNWSYLTSAWVQVGTMLTRSTAFDYVFPLTHDNQDLLTGEMKLQFLHNVTTYNSAHRLYLDWISWEKVESNSQLSSDLAAIKAKTDQLNFTLTNINSTIGNQQVNLTTSANTAIRIEMDNNSNKLLYLNQYTSAINNIPINPLLTNDIRLDYLNANISAIPTNPLLTTDTRLNTLDVPISSRLATSAYIIPVTYSQISSGVNIANGTITSATFDNITSFPITQADNNSTSLARPKMVMAESYASSGAAPTMEQALFETISRLHEENINGIIMDCKKLDGVTSAMTFILDSSAAPTSIRRLS